MPRSYRVARLFAGAAIIAVPSMSVVHAQDQQGDALEIPDVTVIGVSPIEGTGVPRDQVPSNTQSLSSDDIERQSPTNLTDLLNENIGSVSAVDVQNNPFQQNLNYRGFTASPLLGDPQGLAVYQNGVRINEPFGDTVQWDLVPEAAINSVNLVNANPVYGLNALGGAMALDLHDGFSFQGLQVEAEGGYFERARGNLQFGYATEQFAAYIAGEFARDGGWRNASESELGRLYSDLSFQTDSTAVGVNFAFADTDLIGNGLSPIELLDQNRRAIFTTPDQTLNELFLLSVQGDHQLSDTFSIQANAYVRRLMRETLNGDEIEAEECEIGVAANEAALETAITAAGRNPLGLDADDFLCAEVEEDGTETEAEVILDQFGNVVPVFASTYGARNTSSTQTTGYGFGLQGQLDDKLFGYDNLLTVGGSIDMGETKFHSESGIGVLNLDRSVSTGPSPFLNTAAFEFEADGGVVDDADVERGETGPVRVVAENDYYGVFLSDTFSVNEDFAITVSGRWNVARIELKDELNSYFPRTSTLDGSHFFQRFNPAFGATYAIPEIRTTFYAGYSEANRAPSPAELTCADPTAPCRLPNAFVADPPLEQVVSRTFEIGLRGGMPSAWLGGLSSLNWNFGLFHNTNTDDIIFVSAGVGLGTGFFQNVEETKRQGVEVGLNGRAGPARWYANYSYIEATFESSFTVSSANHPLAVASQIPVEPGDDIPGIPNHNVKVGVDFEILPGLLVGGNVVAASGVYLRGDEGNLLERTDPYAVLNLRTSYLLTDWVEIYGWIDNVLNTEYETFGVLGETGDEVPIYELPGGVTNPRFLSPGQPFGAFLGLRIRLN